MKTKRALLSIIFAAMCSTGYAQRPMGEIFFTAANFCPRGTIHLDGAQISTGRNQALFSLLDTRYGGDGRSFFAVPDMRGRMPVAIGRSPRFGVHTIGQQGGRATMQAVAPIPTHSHGFSVSETQAGSTSLDGNALWAGRNDIWVTGSTSLDGQLTTGTMSNTQPSAPRFQTMGPSLGLTACMIVEGVYPSRN